MRGRRFTLKTDHERIRYLQAKSRLRDRQQRWLDELQSHNYDVIHVSGIKNMVTDALSRFPDHMPTLCQISLKHPEFRNPLESTYKKTPWVTELIEALRGRKESQRYGCTSLASLQL